MANLKVPVTSEDHIQGNQKASITLVEYGDYQCPYCGMAYPIVKKLQKHFGNQLRFVFRNFPLNEVHPFAKVAAETAEFAGDHHLFWEMHDLIYENQASLDLPLLADLTTNLGLSELELKTAIENETYDPKVRKDFMGGVHSGVNGTPTFFINNLRYDGPIELEDLIEAIDSKINNGSI